MVRGMGDPFVHAQILEKYAPPLGSLAVTLGLAWDNFSHEQTHPWGWGGNTREGFLEEVTSELPGNGRRYMSV